MAPNIAFNRLGKAPPNKIRVFVEDELAKLLVERARETLDDGEREAIEVRIAPGGADMMLRHLGPASMITGENVYLLLDGDQKRVEKISRRQELTVEDVEDPAKMDDIFLAQLGVKPALQIPGGDPESHIAEKIAAQAQYLEWAGNHVYYLPYDTPEECILRANNVTINDKIEGGDAKARFLSFLSDGASLVLTADDISTLAKIKINKMAESSECVSSIASTLRSMLSD